MKKERKTKKGLTIALVALAVLILAAAVFLFSVRPGPGADDMLFKVGIYNPLSLFTFTGNTYLEILVGNDKVFNAPTMYHVSFEPCARTDWHTHEGGQILIVTYGIGYHQIEGEEVKIIRPGDIAMAKPGVKHWHGAGKDSWFSHIAISTNPDKSGVKWLEAVSDEVYNNLNAVESNEGVDKGLPAVALADMGDGAIFPLGQPNPFSDYFTGNTYLAPLISLDDVFNCPPMSNVIFEPCARTDWHSHNGGQILIAIGGVGYHQIEGRQLDILHSGDVVKVEPGIKHWHGASPDSWFSHIAISTNPGNGAVNWMEPVEDNAYFANVQ